MRAYFTAQSILQVLDDCSRKFDFPMLNNGYVYPATSRLSLHRPHLDWAMVIEVFGYSPRAGDPDLCVYSFGSCLINRKQPEDFSSNAAFLAHREQSPHDASHFIFSIENESYKCPDHPDSVGSVGTVILRGRELPLPSLKEYAEAGIEIDESSPGIQDLCRWLAHHHRDAVLATPEERRFSVVPDTREILVLEDWHHPDLALGELPGETETFRQLCEVLVTGEVSAYSTEEEKNTHWRNWPDGGQL